MQHRLRALPHVEGQPERTRIIVTCASGDDAKCGAFLGGNAHERVHDEMRKAITANRDDRTDAARFLDDITRLLGRTEKGRVDLGIRKGRACLPAGNGRFHLAHGAACGLRPRAIAGGRVCDNQYGRGPLAHRRSSST